MPLFEIPSLFLRRALFFYSAEEISDDYPSQGGVLPGDSFPATGTHLVAISMNEIDENEDEQELLKRLGKWPLPHVLCTFISHCTTHINCYSKTFWGRDESVGFIYQIEMEIFLSKLVQSSGKEQRFALKKQSYKGQNCNSKHLQ